MAFPLHYFVFAPLVFLALLAYIVPGKSPFAVVKDAVLAIRDTRGARMAAGAFAGVLVVSLIEGHFDDALTAALGYDFTAEVLAFEGDFVLNVQNAFLAMPGGDLVIAVLALTYTAGYIAWLALPPFALFGLGRRHAAGTYACACSKSTGLASPNPCGPRAPSTTVCLACTSRLPSPPSGSWCATATGARPSSAGPSRSA